MLEVHAVREVDAAPMVSPLIRASIVNTTSCGEIKQFNVGYGLVAIAIPVDAGVETVAAVLLLVGAVSAETWLCS